MRHIRHTTPRENIGLFHGNTGIFCGNINFLAEFLDDIYRARPCFVNAPPDSFPAPVGHAVDVSR